MYEIGMRDALAVYGVKLASSMFTQMPGAAAAVNANRRGVARGARPAPATQNGPTNLTGAVSAPAPAPAPAAAPAAAAPAGAWKIPQSVRAFGNRTLGALNSPFGAAVGSMGAMMLMQNMMSRD
jgi:hypothetical protein